MLIRVLFYFHYIKNFSRVVKHINRWQIVSLALCSLTFTQKIITMKHAYFIQKLAFLSILFFGTAFTAKAGLDSYEIYLNDKLILKQYVNQPLSLESLQLTEANRNDKLIINYSQCNMPDKIGRGRSILVRDAKGNVLKEWKFANAKGGRIGMEIPVKDLLALDKSTLRSELTLYYRAEQHPGQALTHFRLATKATTYQPKQMLFEASLTVWAFNL